jgi:hypothetical protein
MEQHARDLRNLVSRTQREFESAESQLRQYEQNCRHEFTDTVHDPVYHEAYTIPGDPVGTMGVDWRGPCYVPAETIDRWKRECLRCGIVEYTEGVTETVTRKVPKWREK